MNKTLSFGVFKCYWSGGQISFWEHGF